ncbi:MAG: PAS domain S-box protein, partial [Bacteroidales bacterium]|nr:PAS domain S-box protein [Bacteroidales bacterium]
MAFHPLMKLIMQDLEAPLQGAILAVYEKPSLKDIFDKNQLRDFIKATPLEGDLYYALITNEKQILLETGGKEIKRLLHKSERGIQNQREAVRSLVESNKEEDIAEIQSKNYFHYISVAITYHNHFLGSFVIGGFFIKNDLSEEEIHREWCANTGFDYSDSVKILRYAPIFSKTFVGKLKQYLSSLAHLVTMNKISYQQTHEKAHANQKEKLEEAIGNYKNILHTSADAIWVSDNKFNFLFLNNAGKSLLSVDNEGIASMHLKNMLDSKSFERFKKEIQYDLYNEVPQPRPLSFQAGISSGNKKASRLMHLQAQAMRDSYGNFIGVFGTLKSTEDTTHQLIEHLKSERNLYKSLFNSSFLGFFYYDLNGVVLDCNEKFVDILGSKKEQLIGFSMFNRIQNNELLAQIRRSLNGAQGYYEGIYHSLTGNRRVFGKATFQGVLNENNRLNGGFGILQELTVHKQQEKQLELLKRASDQSPSIEVITDKDHKITYVNRQFTKVTGYTVEDVENTKSKTLADPSEKEKIETIEKELERTHYWEGELKNKTKPGGNFLFSCRMSAIVNEAGEITNYIIVGSDVTQQRRTQVQFHNLLSNLPGIAYRCRNTPQWPMVFLSEGATRLTGYTPDELSGEIDYGELIISQDRDYVWEEVQKQIHNNEAFEITYRIRRKDGKMIWVWERGRMVERINNETFLEGIISDITNLKKTEIALRKSEKQLEEQGKRYRSMFLSNSSVMFLVNPVDGAIIDANEAAIEFYGYPKEKLTHMNLRDINATENTEEQQKRLQEAYNKNRHYFQFKHQLANGSVRDVEVYSSSIKLDANYYLFSVIHDITDRLKAEHDLVKAKEKAEESDHLKTAFLATMSHELRTPLNSIIGFSDLIPTETNREEITRFAQNINSSGVKLLDIIDDVFEMSKLEAGNFQLRKERFKLTELITSVINETRTVAKNYNKENVNITLNFPENNYDHIFLNSDRTKLYQVFINLTKNALKFTQEGTVEIGGRIEDKDILFYVKDTGVGMAKDKQKLVFERFRQLDESNTRKYGGTGLGLSISKEIVEKMGG